MEIIIEFDTNTGKTRIEAEGFNGSGCTTATQPFEEALGVVSDREFKPEYEGFHHHGVYRTANKIQREARAKR